MKKMNVALLIKTLRSPHLECTLFIGRRLDSPGMKKASSLGIKVSDLSIDAIQKDPYNIDLVFDATSAIYHRKHWPILQKLRKKVIDMTPSGIGKMCIPAINIKDCLDSENINMVTCGGQASVPLARAIGQTHEYVDYIEVVSSIASRSAGPATRINLDEYIETTEKGIHTFSGCENQKAILILNPARPDVDMQTTVFALVKEPNMESLEVAVKDVVKRIQNYVPGYELIVPPVLDDDRIVVMVRVRGLGDYLPKYAGNMDIINCAAIKMAEEFHLNNKGDG
jgi:acetaldehyde dehydrogenase (acetylating)